MFFLALQHTCKSQFLVNSIHNVMFYNAPVFIEFITVLICDEMMVGNAENELIHWATVPILKALVGLFRCPPAPFCCQAAECFAESWAAKRGNVSGRGQIDLSFQLQPKAATIIKLGLDHVVKSDNRDMDGSTKAG